MHTRSNSFYSGGRLRLELLSYLGTHPALSFVKLVSRVKVNEEVLAHFNISDQRLRV